MSVDVNYANDYPNFGHLLTWVRRREAAREHGSSGDPNIDNWRYCNVRRQDDRVTKYVTEWLEPYHDHKYLIPNTLMARLFNLEGTLEDLGFLEEWNPEYVQAVCARRAALGHKVFNPAYIVSTNGFKMDKVAYLTEYVLGPAFENPHQLASPDLDTMWYRLTRLNGVGSFMAAQVVADLKFTKRWKSAPDWWTFVAPGPGSMRGLNRLRGLAPDHQKYNQKSFSLFIQPVRAIIRQGTGLMLCAQDAQNCMCEFDKYMRLVTGEGRPKQTYKRNNRGDHV